MTDYLSEVQERFKKDLFATETTGIDIIDVGDHYAKCVLHLASKHRNAMGAVMGGVIYTVSVSGDIKFINSTKGNSLYAEARCLKNGKTTGFYDITINDDSGNIISKVSIVGARVNI